MDQINTLPRPIGSGPITTPTSQHKPLQRVLPNKVVSHQVSELTAAHPLLFTTQQSAPFQKARQPATVTTSDASNPDSCYSSCSEESHPSLSRESSDSTNIEYKQSNIIEKKWIDFATKLGYSENQLRIVLDKLGPDPQQNSVLAELVLLGKTSHSESRNRAQSYEQQLSLDKFPQKLRPIVIDGSNIAMTHGHKEVFSCLGIRECINFFVTRGHTDIIVFVPQFRRETPRSDCPITDQHILFELESEKKLIWTPARHIGGRRIVCHDDKYILKTAEEKDAIIVSNDEYRDLIKEQPSWRSMVEQRLLMYSFVDGKFMPPDDPLGRRGPTLNQFLSFSPNTSTTQLCPYAKKCTYGNKCKYYHPERKNGVRQSVTERLMSNSNGGKAKQNLRERPSMIYETNISRNNRPTALQSPALCNSLNNRNVVGRTQSLNLNQNQQQQQQSFPPQQNAFKQQFQNYQNAFAIGHQPQPMSNNINCSSLWNSHTALERNYSNPIQSNFNQQMPNQYSSGMMQQRPPHQQQFESECVTSRSSSLSDFMFSSSDNSGFYGTYTPSSGVWGESIFPSLQCKPQQPQQQPSSQDNSRLKLQYHLCQLFPEASVFAVMNSHPGEMDPQKLCQKIIAFQKGFES